MSRLILPGILGKKSAQFPTDGLVSYWKLDETSGDVIDSWGNNNGINNGATRGANGIIGNAYEFASDSDYIVYPNVNNELSLTDGGNDLAFTFRFWIRTTEIATQMILGRADIPPARGEYYLRLVDNRIHYTVFRNSNTANSQTYASNVQVALNQWVHIVVVYDLNKIKIYYNSSLVYDSPVIQDHKMALTDVDTYTSRNNFASGQFIRGTLDEMMLVKGTFWDESMIINDYNNGNGITL